MPKKGFYRLSLSEWIRDEVFFIRDFYLNPTKASALFKFLNILSGDSLRSNLSFATSRVYQIDSCYRKFINNCRKGKYSTVDEAVEELDGKMSFYIDNAVIEVGDCWFL